MRPARPRGAPAAGDCPYEGWTAPELYVGCERSPQTSSTPTASLSFEFFDLREWWVGLTFPRSAAVQCRTLRCGRPYRPVAMPCRKQPRPRPEIVGETEAFPGLCFADKRNTLKPIGSKTCSQRVRPTAGHARRLGAGNPSDSRTRYHVQHTQPMPWENPRDREVSPSGRMIEPVT